MIKDLLNDGKIGLTYIVKGWITTYRKQGKLLFISINDGSTVKSLQVVIDIDSEIRLKFKETIDNLSTGASVSIEGKLIESPAKGQKFELQSNIENLKILGIVDTTDYPMSKKRHSLEFIRKIPYLKVRTNLGAIVARIRNTCTFATHSFFQKNGFINIHTPLITSNDCEGAGETFTVTTTHPATKDIIPKSNLINFNEDFFGRQAFLTVSGQLQLESYAHGIRNVYTFGPTFRAENSNTSRHLAEFWMIEPEMCFINLNELSGVAEEYLKYCIKDVLEKNKDDLELLNKFISKGIIENLNNIVKKDFKKITYTEAVDYLINNYNENSNYDLLKWGEDLNSFHEKMLTENFGPTIVYNYPKQIKSFYMKVNEDNKTVQAMDILVPGIGEIIGGSMRENDYVKLKNVMNKKGLLKNGSLDWYLNLRKYGSIEHGGFGLGFERLIMLVTGLKNIKDCIPFPRYPKNCIC